MLPCSCLSICNPSSYYRHVIDNIAVDAMAAGAAYSVVTTRGGSGWEPWYVLRYRSAPANLHWLMVNVASYVSVD